jgi:Cdc6-like AAA superfamily ATPase
MVGHFDRGNDANGIIAKEEILLPDYVPTDALHRKNEMETIAAAINPMIYGKSSTNLFIILPRKETPVLKQGRNCA